MRLIFMGSPEFALPSLKALSQSSHEIVAVYCQPPRAKGRGHQVQKGPIHLFAESLKIPVFTPESLRSKEAHQQFLAHNADIAIVAAYGLILPQEILKIPSYGCINIHASLLPRWRGAAPIQRAILAGDQKTGITIMQMEEGLDTGPMILKGEYPISLKTSFTDLYKNLAQGGADLILEVLKDLKSALNKAVSQPEQGVTYASKILKEEGQLNFQRSAVEIDRQIRAFNPWPGAWFCHHHHLIKILQATVLSKSYGPSGSFTLTAENALIINCSEGALSLEYVQRSGGKPLAIQEFLKGYSAFNI